jgi:hypothetical protein
MKNITRRKDDTTSVISINDFLRIRNTIIPPSKDDDDRKKHDTILKTFSDGKVKQWPDSVEMAKKTKLESRKKVFFEKEMEKRKVDEEERKFQELEKKVVIDRANKMLFENQDPVKSFHSKLLMCDVMKERDFQNDIKSRKKEMDNEVERKWQDIKEQQLLDYDIKEMEKIAEERRKKGDQMNMINEQFQDFKVRKVKEYQDKVIEGEIIKARAKAAILEEKQKEQGRRDKCVEQKNEFIKANYELEKLKEVKKLKDKQEEKKIEEFAIKKQQMQDLKKRKEEEKFREKQNQRQKLIDQQVEYLSNLKNKEDEILNKQIKEAEEKKARQEEEKQKRFNELKVSYKNLFLATNG